MDNTNHSIALARVLIAIAWADGSLSPAVKKHLLNHCRQLAGISKEKMKELEFALNYPADERMRILMLKDLRRKIKTSQERLFAVQSIQQMILADGNHASPEKWAAIEQAIKMIQSPDNGDVHDELQSVFKKFTTTPKDTSPPTKKHTPPCFS